MKILRKIMVIIIVFSLFGCHDEQYQKDLDSMKVYQSYIDLVINNKGVESSTIPFNYKLNVKKENDNSYSYEIDIYNPQVAMYQIKAIAVNQSVDANTNLYPCIGILGSDAQKSFNMIPYQGNGKKGFVKMITLDAISANEDFTVNVLVTWKDATLQNESRAFFNCHYVAKKGDDSTGNKTTSEEGKIDAQTSNN